MKNYLISGLLLALLSASNTTQSAIPENSSTSESASIVSSQVTLEPEGYRTDAITLVDKAVPFDNFEEWLADVKKNARNEKMVSGFQRNMGNSDTDRLLANTESHWIAYQSDGLKISGVMAYPKNWQGGKLPVVIFNRGGNFKHNVSRVLLVKRLLPIAEQGYLVLASNYRGSRYSEGKDEFGGEDVNDVLRLIEIAKTIPNADASKIALFGWSRGAMMTWQALRQNTQDISAAIVGAGVVDMAPELQRRPEMEKLLTHMVPDFKENRESHLKQRSAINWMQELNAEVPVLLLHGDKDWRVDVTQSQMAAQRLEELQHPHELVVYPGGDHSLSEHQDDVQRRVLGFLEAHLR